MQLNEVISSNIKGVGYEDGNLYVEYLSGTKYKYKAVPETLYEEFKKAESKGKFMNAEIKGKFEFEKCL